MSSGQYSALTGAIARLTMLEDISDNLSNTSTAGFKKNQAVFESLLQQSVADRQTGGINFNKLRQGFIDYNQGTLQVSGSPLHLGIEGEGYFKIQGEGGRILYTRQGNFQMAPSGEIETLDGWRLLGDDGRPILLTRPDVEIDERGNILIPGGEAKPIPLYTFGEEGILERRGNSRFALVSETKDVLVADPRIYQGRLEQSNVNMMYEMTRMMDALRSFEALQKTLMAYNELGKKANELGTL